jgi:hypothetical protein
MLTSIWSWVAFAILLSIQNAAFAVTGRARASGSDLFHGIASVFSNGTWVVVNVMLFAQWSKVWETQSVPLLVGVALFYVTFTVVGAVYGGKVSRRFFEQGNRRVGHYEVQEQLLQQLQETVATLDIRTQVLGDRATQHAQHIHALARLLKDLDGERGYDR